MLVEITTLRNRSSAQDVRSSDGFCDFLFLCTFTISDNLLITSLLNQLRNGFSQDVRVNTLLQCVPVQVGHMADTLSGDCG